MPLLNIVIALIIVGVGLWLINRFIPMAASIKTILNVVVVVSVSVWVLQVTGVMGADLQLSAFAISAQALTIDHHDSRRIRPGVPKGIHGNGSDAAFSRRLNGPSGGCGSGRLAARMAEASDQLRNDGMIGSWVNAIALKLSLPLRSRQESRFQPLTDFQDNVGVDLTPPHIANLDTQKDPQAVPPQRPDSLSAST